MENEKINAVNSVPFVDNVIEITLPETTKKLKIDGKTYLFNTDSIELLREIERIGEEVKKIDSCKHGIDLALGSGTFVELFGDNMDSYMRPLYLLSQLIVICREATKDVVAFEYSSERASNRK